MSASGVGLPVRPQASGPLPVARGLLPMTAPVCDEMQDNSAFAGLSRSVQRRLRIKFHWQPAVNSAAERTNDLHGVRADEDVSLDLSRAQLESQQHLSAIFIAIPPPPCMPVEAFRELRGTRAGYDDADPRVAFRHGLLSLPSRGGVADGAEVLSGDTLHHGNNCA